MELAFPHPDRPLDTSWYEPLHLIVERIGGDRAYDSFEPGDFTPRARVLRPRSVDVVQYRHRPTGKYFYADFTGRVFRFAPPKDKARGTGRLVEIRRLEDALDALLDHKPAAQFSPPPERRPDGRPALRLIHGDGK